MLTSSVPAQWGSAAAAPAPIGPAVHVSTDRHVAAALSSPSEARGTAGPLAAPLQSLPSTSYTESGWAQFFTDAAIPNPTAGNNTCTGPSAGYFLCWNTTTEPSLNLTSDGYTGLAYTAFTNQSPCASQSGSATSEVGWVVSTDFGLTWSSPAYLGNPVCTGVPDQNYSSAFEPSLTSLANGTFVLTYIEYNVSAGAYPYYAAPPSAMACGSLQGSRVVVTESYNHGATWTTPTTIDGAEFDPSTDTCPMPGFPDLRPQITAIGDTIYLTWANVSNPLIYLYNAPASAWVKFTHSADGGQSWSSIQHLSVLDNTVYGSATDLAINPTVVTDPSGSVYLAYATDFGTTTACLTICSTFPSASVLVARSTDNGSTFAYHTAASHVLLDYPNFYPYVYWDPIPALAHNPVSDQVYLSFAAGDYGNFCYNQFMYGAYCFEQLLSKIFFENSSDGGVSWSSPHLVAPVNASAPWYSPEINPSIAVDRDGKVHLQYLVKDDANCQWLGGPYGLPMCAPAEDRYTNSTDNGTTWTVPLLVATDLTPAYGPWWDIWPGTYTATLAAGREVLLGWTKQWCNALVIGCSLPAFSVTPTLPGTFAEVVTSRLYESAGLTITFNETGLPSGLVWSVDVQGNFRNGPAGVNLSISGVPPGLPIEWTTTSINPSYGIAYSATPLVPPPASFAANTAVIENYQEQVLIQLLTNPGGYAWYTFAYNYYSNVALAPLPGRFWVPSGTSLTFNQTYYNSTYSYCYACLNLTFLSWTGVGAGSVSSNASSITFVPTGPVNETANFQLNGVCYGAYYWGFGFPDCIAYLYDLGFEEQGLPDGTNWGVTTTASNGTWKSVTTTNPSLTIPIGPGAASFRAWTVPDPATGGFWVPSSSEASPLSTPIYRPIILTYSLEPIGSAEFATTFEESGLPSGTLWGLAIDGTEYGMTNSNGSFSFQGGSSLAVNGSAVYEADGTGYYVSSITVTPWVVNATPFTLAPSGSFVVNGSARVVLHYSPIYRLTVTASGGGTASPASLWVRPGDSVTLAEVAAIGFHFVSWTGTGRGSVTSGTMNPTISPVGVVTEFATFRPNASPTWNLTVQTIGLPAGTPCLISIGNTTYSGLGPFTVGNFSDGRYATFLPTVFLNATETTRFVPIGFSSSLTLEADGSLDLNASGTVSITYGTQYALSLAATPGGTATWGPRGTVGLSWFNASEPLALLASPDPGHYFVGWNGTGSGSVSASTPTITIRINGPVTESAQFQARPIGPPATFWLAVTEAGLPANTSWSVVLGEVGASGTSTTLTVVDLNGTYGLTAASVYSAPGVRWVSNADNETTAVTENGTLSVTYVEQYEVTVRASAGGAVTPAGTEWVDAGSIVDLAAVAGASSQFVSWTGSGSGSYTGPDASVTVTVDGPITEQAAFAPAPSHATSSGPGTGAPLAFGLLAVLLVAGAVLGMRFGRRRH